MNDMKSLQLSITICSALLMTACGAPEDAAVLKSQPQEAGKSTFPTAVFWGDTHLHTTDSPDAFAFGNRLGPEDALRFARGEKVTATSGLEARLSRPLDFLVIADHAVGLGIAREVYEGNPVLTADPRIQRWHEMMQAGGEEADLVAREMIDGHLAGTNPPAMSDPEVMGPIVKNIWQERGHIVERYNEPGKFTAFIGYEFTSTPKGDNLHRVVVFRDGADKTNTILPFSSAMSEDPEDLWAALNQYETSTGGQALAIPHNSNVSNGRMFAFTDFEGDPIDAEYASTRARWEPLVEVTQIKGDSESHPFLSPNDEFAGYGDAGWDRGNLNLSGLKTDDMLAGDYVREALKRGLAIEADTGVNPFKLGMIGSTDSHTALATADSDNFFGKHTNVEPRAGRATFEDPLAGRGLRIGWHYLASGYAAVWAQENTREAIFDAMMRKEVYATTGPRITLRFFGGWDFGDDDAGSADFAERGYAKGVPMGSDLPLHVGNGAPTFLLSALMDPDGANLDRMQLVKGWVDSDGALRERVYDVVWSGDRAPGEDGKLPLVGDTVDLSVPSWSNTIGAPELKAAWTDSDFDPGVPAFYYVRVIEIPTPRWTAYDAIRYGADIPDDASLKTTERAYSSPIWYSPTAN
ncbi:MAG: DUF3604 domain-containing protein [Gammaproteobacteria bacterium]|nr:DUF3604 domain-containing protein [Gammaproteobacteria bacterium]